MPPLYLTDWFPNKQPEVRGLFSHPTNVLLNFCLIIIFVAKNNNRCEIEASRLSRLRKTFSQKYLSELFSNHLWIINMFLKSSLIYRQAGNQNWNTTEQTAVQEHHWCNPLGFWSVPECFKLCYLHSHAKDRSDLWHQQLLKTIWAHCLPV